MKLILNIPKKRLIVYSFFFAGLLLFTIYLCLYKTSDYEVDGNVRLLGYFSYFFLLTGIYILLIISNRVFLSNVVLTVLFFLIFNLVCFFLLGLPSSFKKKFSIPPMPENHIGRSLGVVPYADSVIKAILVKDNDTVYNVEYSIDANHKRYTPGHNSEKKKYALFFGCSLTFGVGVQDNQTMPYYFQEVSGEYNSYNFALPAQGTNHMLARLQFSSLKAQVKEENGIAFYIFFWDHIYRSIGSMDRYCRWLYKAPYYTMKNGKLVRKKLFRNGRYVISKFYELVYQNSIVNYFKLDFPLKINDKHLDLVTEMVKESKNEYMKQFHNDKFYCVIYPNYFSHRMDMINKFKELLTAKNIEYIDFTDFKYVKKHSLGGDPHPNPETHQLIAKMILNEYKNNFDK